MNLRALHEFQSDCVYPRYHNIGRYLAANHGRINTWI